MFTKVLKKDQGFTLIEIVLVLAIAGLIMLIVFLAVGGAQRARRDTQRVSDVGRMAAQLEAFASNNNGAYPADQGTFKTALTGTFALTNVNDPLTGLPYEYSKAQPPQSSPALSSGVAYSLSGRIYTVCINLEQGLKCVSNQ